MPFAYHAPFSWPVPPHSPSLAYFCATCGEVWARITVELAGPWIVIHRPCAVHRPVLPIEMSYPPASLSIPSHWGPAGAVAGMTGWPAGLLRRELEIYLNHSEKEIGE